MAQSKNKPYDDSPEGIQRMINRRKLMSESGFRRFHSDLIKEAERCFDDHDRHLDGLVKMVEDGLRILKSGVR